MTVPAHWDVLELNRGITAALGHGWTARSAQRLSGGAIQENWQVVCQHDNDTNASDVRELVLRADADTGVEASQGRDTEANLLLVAWDIGLPVPRPYGACQATGRPGFLMQFRPGVADARRLVRDDALVPNRAALARDIGRAFARLHRITPKEMRLRGLPAAAPDAGRAVLQVQSDFLAHYPLQRPVLNAVIQWLAAHHPEPVAPVLTHRDFRTGNYLVHDGRLSAILDWEFAAWSDPAEDLGWFTACCWRFGQNEREAGGIARLEDLRTGYESEGGIWPDADRLHYWQVMAHLRWAVIALQQAERVMNGEASLELALTGRLVPEIERVLLKLTELDPERAEHIVTPITRPDDARLMELARDTLLRVLPQIDERHHYDLRQVMSVLQRGNLALKH